MRAANRLRFFALAAVFAAGVSGCAYRVGDFDRQIPGGYKTIAIPVFVNKTMEAGIETYFTNAVIREFQRGRVGRVLSKADAQTTLEGSIDSVSYRVTSQVNSDDTTLGIPEKTILNTEYRIVLVTSIRVRRNSDQKILWEGSFNGERSYLAPRIGAESVNTSNAIYNQSARNQNIATMASDLMIEAHNRITENF
ncbi:MAG: hypothetical protein EOP05_02770 [Proteobacteria bacterium]|nr:MAG: hypothetical protein EOP05_02770 [Pseudomonadota bacterium]